MIQTEVHPQTPVIRIRSKLNWLRAGVLGANDGIVSVAAIVVGVAAASVNTETILIAGVAALAAGAVSMGLGEYVSVSSQRDTERALIARTRWDAKNHPENQLHRLASRYEKNGLTPATALLVAEELSARDAVAANLMAEYGIDQDDVANPWHAAWASAAAFLCGAVLPLLAILLPPANWRIPTTFVAVLVALTITGWISAWIGDSPRTRAVLRVIIGGTLALAATWTIGAALGVNAH